MFEVCWKALRISSSVTGEKAWVLGSGSVRSTVNEPGMGFVRVTAEMGGKD